ncbi:MAG: hypothetical protein K5765_08005 [Clostridia bacterium]|nr:hypothetical protein [Clostridia bacterium]
MSKKKNFNNKLLKNENVAEDKTTNSPDNADKENIETIEQSKEELDNTKSVKKKEKIKYTPKQFFKRFWYWFVVMPLLIVGILLWLYFMDFHIEEKNNQFSPDPEIIEKGITDCPENVDMYLGRSFYISIDSKYAGATFSMDNGGIVEIDDDGYVKAVKIGTDVIHVIKDSMQKDIHVNVTSYQETINVKVGFVLTKQYLQKGIDLSKTIGQSFGNEYDEGEETNKPNVLQVEETTGDFTIINPGKASIEIYQDNNLYRIVNIYAYAVDDEYWNNKQETIISESLTTSFFKDYIIENTTVVDFNVPIMQTGYTNISAKLKDNSLLTESGIFGFFCAQGDEYLNESKFEFYGRDVGDFDIYIFRIPFDDKYTTIKGYASMNDEEKEAAARKYLLEHTKVIRGRIQVGYQVAYCDLTVYEEHTPADFIEEVSWNYSGENMFKVGKEFERFFETTCDENGYLQSFTIIVTESDEKDMDKLKLRLDSYDLLTGEKVGEVYISPVWPNE